jgi:tetratricopeptide (TPR) repeat protein
MRTLPIALLICALPSQGAGYQPRADLDSGRYLKALWEAEALLRREPGNALAWAAKSQALTSLLRLDEALEAARRSLELKPGLADGLLARGLARAGLAVQNRNLGSLRQVSAAMDDLRAAVQADPGLVTGWMTLGLIYEQLPGILGGSSRKALDCAASLRKVSPPRGDLLQGTILSLQGRWGQAQPFFARALAGGPWDAEVVYGYLEALGSRETRKVLGDAEQKRLLAQEAWRLLPGMKNRARAVQAISDALLDADQGEAAWQVAMNALPHADAPSLMRLQLGKVAARSGVHAQEGLAYLDQVLRESLEGGSGGYATVHWRRGQILQRLGHKTEARSAAQAALAVDPKDPKAAKLLKELS